MSALFGEHIIAPGKLALFLMFVAFVATFLFIRFSVRMIRAGVSWWPGNVQPGGLHIHHVVFGMAFMLVAGVLAFAPLSWDSPWWEIMGALFGIGAALVLDEFALILHLDDVYWSERGRLSVEVIALAIGLIGLLVLGFLPFGVEGVAYQDTVGRWTYVGTILLNGVLVVVTLAKGRVWLGLFGLLLPVLALLGAVLIAKPNSLWARRRYPVGSRSGPAPRRAPRGTTPAGGSASTASSTRSPADRTPPQSPISAPGRPTPPRRPATRRPRPPAPMPGDDPRRR